MTLSCKNIRDASTRSLRFRYFLLSSSAQVYGFYFTSSLQTACCWTEIVPKIVGSCWSPQKLYRIVANGPLSCVGREEPLHLCCQFCFLFRFSFDLHVLHTHLWCFELPRGATFRCGCFLAANYSPSFLFFSCFARHASNQGAWNTVRCYNTGLHRH